jgi:hypothetical protein
VWVVGTLILFVVGVSAGVAIGWARRRALSPPLWDIPGLGGTYTGIVGTLAGFSVASATFIAGLDYPRESPEFAAVIAMLLISFLVLISTAMMYSTTPNAPDSTDSGVTVQSLSIILANGSYFLGLALSWLALRPLSAMIGLASLADAFTWLLLVVVFGGSGRLALFAYRLTLANGLACAAFPIIGISLATGYRLLAAHVWPGLWPASEMPLRFAFVAFAVAAAGFTMQTALLLMHGDTRIESRLGRYGHRLALAYLQATVLSVALLWLAVATS